MKTLTDGSVLTRMASLVLRGLAAGLDGGGWEPDDGDEGDDPGGDLDTELVVDDELARRLSEGYGP